MIRIFAKGDKSAGEPGYASEKVNFYPVRDPMDWSLPPVWHVPTSRGNTPMIPLRLELYARLTEKYPWRHDLESDSHIVTGRNPAVKAGYRYLPSEAVGTAFIHRNAGAMPRARLKGHPAYADDLPRAAEAVARLGDKLRDRVVVEDPTRPLPDDAAVSGTARIVEDLPEKVSVQTDAAMPSYLVLSDTFDPGWSATIDGVPAPIRPAYIAFRAVYVPKGSHTVVFTYRPAGFATGLTLTGCGVVLGLFLWFRPRTAIALAPEHAVLGWPPWWPTAWFGALAAIVLASTIAIGPDWRIAFQRRWRDSVHTHTWGSGLEAQKSNRM